MFVISKKIAIFASNYNDPYKCTQGDYGCLEHMETCFPCCTGRFRRSPGVEGLRAGLASKNRFVLR